MQFTMTIGQADFGILTEKATMDKLTPQQVLEAHVQGFLSRLKGEVEAAVNTRLTNKLAKMTADEKIALARSLSA